MKTRITAIIILLALGSLLLAIIFGSVPLGRGLTTIVQKPDSRSNHLAVTLASGEVVLIGGESKRASVGYDPVMGHWQAIGPPIYP